MINFDSYYGNLRLFAVILYIAIPGLLFAQDKLDFGDTEKTSQKPSYSSNEKDFEQERIRYWVVNKSKGTLDGNKCFEDVCLEMGFQFLIQNRDSEQSYSTFKRLFHNLGVKTAIFFKNGPFWRIKLNRKRKECLRQTHDFLG